MKKALVLIDIQNDYFANGNHVLYQPEIASKNAKKILENSRDENIEIIHIQHFSTNEGADFFFPNTIGAEIHSDVKPHAGEKIIIKNYPNSFRDTELQQYLAEKQITELLICGMMTDVCIAATVRSAMDLGYRTTIIGDACATEDRTLYGNSIPAKQIHESVLAGLTALGNLYATVITTDNYLGI
ncbi:cysteine hydrolase family protein [Flavobacterium sp. 3-218]